ncbi:MAG TPA: hypothetical protein VE078_17070 [Thermoanaerobaculia bacterium]|nr:hypothetical protein [Thermoanaerobaculia bacterium]
MKAIITSPTELRQAGFRALTKALGWVNAVRFLRQYDPGAGDYTSERGGLLPDWDAATLVQKAKELQEARSKGA